jgi:beta-lactam-binding protein with PASTA domain
VLSQSPAPDTVVRHGWQVRVTESLGPQQVTIPNVVGETLRDASVDVRRDQLDLGTLARVEAPGEEDMVLSQTPPPDAGVDQPKVNLLLSTAPAVSANAIVLPSFLGLTSAGAIRAASELGLVVGGVGDGPVVTAQAPGEGSRVVRGDSVRVSLGGTSVAMPVAAAKPAVSGSEVKSPTGATTAPGTKSPAGTPGVVPAPIKPATNGPAKKPVVPPGPISLQIPN